MLILLDIDHEPGDCKACKFYARGCAVKLLHKCPLQDGIKAVELSSWSEICNADRIFGIKQEDSKND
jgi:hypothetical protein